MPIKIINATEARVGSSIIVDGIPCVVKKMDISKTGKHGHAKVRFEAVGMIDGKKKVLVVPGHERFDVPLVEKKKGQVLSKSGENISIMDIISFETLDMKCSEEIFDSVTDGDQVEYWIVEGEKIVKRKV